jgi:hypothetical protein
MAALDAAGGGGRFESLRAHWTGAREFPDVDSTLRELGVFDDDGSIRLDDTAPLAAVRRAIMVAPIDRQSTVSNAATESAVPPT